MKADYATLYLYWANVRFDLGKRVGDAMEAENRGPRWKRKAVICGRFPVDVQYESLIGAKS